MIKRPYRVLVAQPVIDQIEAATADYPRVLEAFEALKWMLGGRRDIGLPVGGPKNPLHIYRQASRAEAIPIIEVLYRFDDKDVEIVAVRLVPRDHGLSRTGDDND